MWRLKSTVDGMGADVVGIVHEGLPKEVHTPQNHVRAAHSKHFYCCSVPTSGLCQPRVLRAVRMRIRCAERTCTLPHVFDSRQ